TRVQVRARAARLHDRPTSGTVGDRLPHLVGTARCSVQQGDRPRARRQRDQGDQAGGESVMPALGLLASQLAVLAAGYSLLRAVGVAESKVSAARLIGLSYLAGWASTGVLLALALVLGVGESVPVILVLVGAQIVIFLWLGRKAEPLGPPSRPVLQSRHPLAV